MTTEKDKIIEARIMETKEAREILKENFDEITQTEYANRSEASEDILYYYCKGFGGLYFKPKEKFPKVFEKLIEITLEEAEQKYQDTNLGYGNMSEEEFEILLKKVINQAIKLSQELRGGK